MALITSDCDAMRCPSIKWLESPRIVMRCATRASNGPDHLGLCALQANDELFLSAIGPGFFSDLDMLEESAPDNSHHQW